MQIGGKQMRRLEMSQRATGILMAILVAVLLPLSGRADEPARLALVIGNKTYSEKVGPLKNPHNDVALVEAALTKLGFKVTVLRDADYRTMDTALKRYVREVNRAGPGALSFFYYSGHGVANPETRINYLIPVDVSDPDSEKIWDEALQQNIVIDMLSTQAPRATHFVVFDACRNELHITGPGSKALGADKGFIAINTTPGILIAYATAPSKTASDVGDSGGPYAKALADEIVRPGLEAVEMFRRVQIKVKQSIGQDPWLSFPSLPEVYLAGKQAPPQTSICADTWQKIQHYDSLAVMRDFVKRCGSDEVHGQIGKVRLAELEEAEKLEAKRTASGEQSVMLQPSAEPPKRAPEQQASPPAAPTTAVKLSPGEVFRDCPDCPEMVVIPAGSFMMGSPKSEPGRNSDEGPRRRVTIAQAFAAGKFEVTRNEWDACVAASGCKYTPPTEDLMARPVSRISWVDAQEYASWLSKKTGKNYRLLTESEWEYAARAGTTTPFATGGTISSDQANFSNGSDWENVPAYSSTADGTRRPMQYVGAFKANSFGLYDMHGNASEWVEDCYADSYAKAPSNGSKASDTKDCTRVIRGGYYRQGPVNIRSASRRDDRPDTRQEGYGFRVARTLSP